MAQKIILGSKVKDNISGFTGMAVARTEWLFGCARIGVQPQNLYEGNPIDPQWFDELQLEILELLAKPLTEGAVMHEEKPGGPRQDPAPRSGRGLLP